MIDRAHLSVLHQDRRRLLQQLIDRAQRCLKLHEDGTRHMPADAMHDTARRLRELDLRLDAYEAVLGETAMREARELGRLVAAHDGTGGAR